MRPAASASGTVSAPTTGCTRSVTSASAASTLNSVPPSAKQSSLSCAMGLMHPTEDEIGNGHDIGKGQHWQRRRQCCVGGDRDDMRIVGIEERFSGPGPVHFKLLMSSA